jgi:hypothetical protein
MKLLRRKKRTTPVPGQVPFDESMHAMDEAAQHLIEVQQRADEVRKHAELARVTRTRNHFAEQLQEMIGQRPRKQA